GTRSTSRSRRTSRRVSANSSTHCEGHFAPRHARPSGETLRTVTLLRHFFGSHRLARPLLMSVTEPSPATYLTFPYATEPKPTPTPRRDPRPGQPGRPSVG